MMGYFASTRRLAGLTAALFAIWSLAACNSQPAKYRHSNDCKCPKWNYLPKPPSDSEHATAYPPAAPYYCGTGSRS